MRKRNLFLVTLILLAGTRASSRNLKELIPGPAREISRKGETIIRVKITAYTSSADECGNNRGITASGERASDGTLACNFLPFYTRVKIPALFGDKEFVVHDRMSRRKRNFVDVWVDNKKKAFKIGKRSLTIVLVDA